jgi:hypothetical protein
MPATTELSQLSLDYQRFFVRRILIRSAREASVSEMVQQRAFQWALTGVGEGRHRDQALSVYLQHAAIDQRDDAHPQCFAGPLARQARE